MESSILSILIFSPLVGVALMFVAYFLKQDDIVFKYIALLTTSLQLILTGWLYLNFDPTVLLTSENAKFSVQLPWIDNINIQYYIGVDGLSMPLVCLTSLLMLYA